MPVAGRGLTDSDLTAYETVLCALEALPTEPHLDEKRRLGRTIKAVDRLAPPGTGGNRRAAAAVSDCRYALA